MTRADAERMIGNLYGVDSDQGLLLMVQVVERLGLKALTDEAVIALAKKQEEHHLSAGSALRP